MGRQCPDRPAKRSTVLWAPLPALIAVAVVLVQAAPGRAADESKPPKDPEALEHVMDDADGDWELFLTFKPHHFHLPKIAGFQITKFMVMEVIAALLVLACYIPLAKRLRSGTPPRGAWDNLFEVFLTFVRDRIAKPSLGDHDADRYVPFLWTVFLFILFNNLLGMVPFGASATGSIYVTVGLALCVFIAIHGSAVAKMGFVHYMQTLWPHFDVPFGLGYIIKPVVFVIELVSVLVRNGVLAVRLFANMFAGHMVLATILIFIWTAARASTAVWATVTVSSVFGILALSLLELFVAFLQAYIFTFLTSLFMGMAMHPAH
jgi:F-type H+-transporting ATPase subunit a